MDELHRTLEQLAQELRNSEERFHTFMNQAPFVAFIKDEQGRFLYYNPQMATRFDITPEQWIGKTDFEIWPESIADLMHQNDLEVFSSGVPMERLEETLDPDGNLVTWKVHKFTWRDARGNPRLGGIGLDLSEEMAREKALAEANLKLQKLAAIDGLTGLGNRRFLDERVEYEFRLTQRRQSALSAVLLDIDNFKRRNDLYGHASGDEVLQRLGHAISSTLRVTDVAARYGGEEFVILLPGAASEGAKIFAERLRERMLHTPWPDEPVTASFGIATLDASISSGSQLIVWADQAMYEAKRTGKDRIVDFHNLPAGTLPQRGPA